MSAIADAMKAKSDDRDAERELRSLQLAETRRQTELIARLVGNAVNNVMLVETATFPASGVITRSFQTVIGSLLLAVAGNAAVTVVSGANSSNTAPTTGVGVQVVAAATKAAPCAIGSASFTLYGTQDQSVSYQVFTGMSAFGVNR